MNQFAQTLVKLYGKDNVDKQMQRYQNLIHLYNEKFGQTAYSLFSTPGRTEIGGNHTDHNHGRVLAGSVNLDSIAVASPGKANEIKVFSVGYEKPFVVDLGNLDIVAKEEGTTNSLIRGIAARFSQLGYNIGSFNAYITSDVLPGSGLSSSASIEVLIGTIFNCFFNENKIAPAEIAIIGQFAENNYFGKPCGLMDQTACAVGGIITIDFKNPAAPIVEKVDFDFEAQHYNLVVVDTGGNHADLTDDYAAVPAEMRSVAAKLKHSVCRDFGITDLLPHMGDLRKTVGDRALLRTLHFLQENERVVDQVNALKQNEFQRFLSLISESGNSSFKWLQNIYTTKNVSEQGVTLALALTEYFLTQINAGACRVHGGGFAGTIQVFIPADKVAGYVKLMEPIFGENSVLVLKIRPYGAVNLMKI